MTPEDILSHPARVLTPEQRRFYFDNGYVVVKQAIDRPWLDRLRAAWSGGYVGPWAHQKEAKAAPIVTSAAKRGSDY